MTSWRSSKLLHSSRKISSTCLLMVFTFLKAERPRKFKPSCSPTFESQGMVPSNKTFLKSAGQLPWQGEHLDWKGARGDRQLGQSQDTMSKSPFGTSSDNSIIVFVRKAAMSPKLS